MALAPRARQASTGDAQLPANPLGLSFGRHREWAKAGDEARGPATHAGEQYMADDLAGIFSDQLDQHSALGAHAGDYARFVPAALRESGGDQPTDLCKIGGARCADNHHAAVA